MRVSFKVPFRVLRKVPFRVPLEVRLRFVRDSFGVSFGAYGRW